jgi:hypothetical protein
MPICRDQAVETLAREDHDISLLSAGKLRADGLRSVTLRGARAGRHLDAAPLLELRKQLFIGAGEAARNQDFHLCNGSLRQHQQHRDRSRGHLDRDRHARLPYCGQI